MNQNHHPDSVSDVPWPTSDHRMRVPDTSMLPGSENAPTPAAGARALHAMADPLREVRDEWVETARSTVRGHPLASVAAALALGAVIARLTR